MKKLNTKQAGFTLIEIAIVMVIIGILLGGVIKGQELVATAKEKRVYTDFKSLQAVVFVYNDRYGKYPGDTDAVAGYTEAEIKGTATTPGFWASLKESGFVDGKATDSSNNYITTNEKNAFGGEMFFTPDKEVCFTQIPRLPAKGFVDNRNATAYLTDGQNGYKTDEASETELKAEANKDFKVCFDS